LCSFIHLVDCIVHRIDQVLDVSAIERGDEGTAHRRQNLPRDFVSFGFAVKYLHAVMLDLVATLQQATKCLCTGENNRGVPHEEAEETLLLGHQGLKPAKHLLSRVIAVMDSR